MSKSSQVSSPITQWQTRLRHTLKLVPESQRELAKDELTSSTIELVQNLIGEDEPLESTWRASKGVPIEGAKERNELRKQLRQSLKELI